MHCQYWSFYGSLILSIILLSFLLCFVKSGYILFLPFFDWSTFCGSGYISLIPPYVVISRGREQSRRGPEGPPLVRQGRPSGLLAYNIYFYHLYVLLLSFSNFLCNDIYFYSHTNFSGQQYSPYYIFLAYIHMFFLARISTLIHTFFLAKILFIDTY